MFHVSGCTCVTLGFVSSDVTSGQRNGAFKVHRLHVGLLSEAAQLDLPHGEGGWEFKRQLKSHDSNSD